MKAFLLDIDGTTLLGEAALPGAVAFLKTLRGRGIPHLWLTNNSSLSRDGWHARLERAGLEPRPREIYTSGDATIDFLRGLDPVPSVYLVGTRALRRAFEEAGLVLAERDAEAVVLGYDTELTYAKICAAAHLLQRGAPFYATHPDVTCPSPEGPLPDIGAFIAMFESACGRRPTILGKPQASMAAGALGRLGVAAGDAAVVGDRLETDIRMANDAGLASFLVLTGVTTAADAAASADRPTRTFADLRALDAWLKSEQASGS